MTSRAKTNARKQESTISAEDHYQREKARRAKRAGPESELLDAARREYLALLEAEAARGKGGRPKKTAAKKPDVDEDSQEDGESNDE